MESCPELDHDRACYKELVRTEFDPTGCVPTRYFDLEKLSDSLNAAQDMLEQRIPNAPAQNAAYNSPCVSRETQQLTETY